jgi:hypothetical protein
MKVHLLEVESFSTLGILEQWYLCFDVGIHYQCDYECVSNQCYCQLLRNKHSTYKNQSVTALS